MPLKPISIEPAFPNLAFRQLTNLIQANDASSRLFATEQPGRILVFPNDPLVKQASVFLDLTSKVSVNNNEEGLLGLALDPSYKENAYFYVFYSAANPRRSILSRFSVRPDNPLSADPATELVLLEIPKSFGNHNGGQILFGPDGYLYIGLGDGGGTGDPTGNGQNLGTLLGKILRIDVRGASTASKYKVPSDNPFVGVSGARGEIWASGLRNPWRFSFDPQTNLLWVADVGQNQYEEINIVKKGMNYGWNIMEGNHCYSPAVGCNTNGLELPVTEYDHSQGCSVTGGFVYRGAGIPYLSGIYLYGDYCSGNIWGLRYNGSSALENKVLLDSNLNIASFAQDAQGNLYVLSRDNGIYRVLPTQ